MNIRKMILNYGFVNGNFSIFLMKNFKILKEKEWKNGGSIVLWYGKEIVF